MPATLSYPGVYVEEIPSGVRTIVGVSTSNTAFIDFFPKGPVGQPVRITSFEDFTRNFGGLHPLSEASYAIKQYYLNGGQIAFVVRAQPVGQGVDAPRKAQIKLTDDGSPESANVVFIVEAVNEGDWGNRIQVAVDHETAPDPVTRLPRNNEFNLVVRLLDTVNGRRQVVQQEVHRNLSMDKSSPRYAVDSVAANSRLVRLIEQGIGTRPGLTALAGSASTSVTTSSVINDVFAGDRCVPKRTLPGVESGGSGGSGGSGAGSGVGSGVGSGGGSGGSGGGSGSACSDSEELNPAYVFRSQADASLQSGDDGGLPNTAGLEAGLNALDAIAPEIFNILCLPGITELDDGSYDSIVESATKFCRDRRAFFLVDIPSSVSTPEQMTTFMGARDGLRDQNAAIYFPRVLIADPLNENRPRNVGPSGTIAGVYASTDASRGVWKAPAGTDAALNGARLVTKINDLENGGLNPFGINALRSFPIFGDVVWGARTLEGADIQASEWKYIPVRRTALFIEESLFQGLKWVVFEPNDEPLWAQIRLNVGAFMHNLFRQGAFQGSTPARAYLVKCDSETTTQTDIDLGIVNIVVGCAPLKPAEFVIIRIQQLAGQIEV